MITRLLLVIGVFVLGSEATSFTSKSDLKTAVDSCLAFDEAGDDGRAVLRNTSVTNIMTRNADMGGTRSVTDMGRMFRDASVRSRWDTSSVTSMEIGVQLVGHELRVSHDVHV